MEFFMFLVILAYIAIKDYQDRDIPQWALASAWFFYGLSVALFKANQITDFLLVLAIPIFSLGLFWGLHLVIEKLHKRKVKITKFFRFGLADVFVFPLMMGVLSQFNLGICILWAVSTFGYASLWFKDFQKGIVRKDGIPILTFAIFALYVCILAVWLIN